MPVLSTLLPAAAAVAQWRDGQIPDTAVDAAPYPGDECAVSRAVPKRRREFSIARSIARQALQELGLPPVAIPKGPSGEPLWPPSVVGSITHCAGYAAAAVAPRKHVLTVGIDAEPNEPLPDGVLGLTASTTEIDRLDALATVEPRVRWERLAFCAKEAYYKAWFPVQGTWLGFEDVDVRIERDGHFHGRLLVPTPHSARFRHAEVGGRSTTGCCWPRWCSARPTPPDPSPVR